MRSSSASTWRRVCGLLRDVGTALALLHSRRLVHRDVSAGNVRCALSGAAKLIDFGTMIPMGVAEDAVGTPPFVSPEALRGEALDGRVNLYALGAAAYWLLLKRHAYPAGDLTQLTDLWRSRPADPHRLDPPIPEHLSELVMALLSLDRSRRPSSAGEVVERLTAIAGITLDDGPALRAAYLQTPKLVGRDRMVAELRKRLMQVTRGRGGCVLIEGEPGMARSRLLDRCVPGRSDGHAPLQMAELYLRAARTALAAGEEELFADYARAYASIAKTSGAPEVLARYEALMEAAQGAHLQLSDEFIAFGSDVTQRLGAKRRRARSL
ncbi:MAG TPA: AAA family ATPase [Polyangiales bacterium]